MRKALSLLALAVLSGALAQNKTEPLYCGYKAAEIPVVQRFPSLYGGISPQVMTSEGAMTFTVQFDPGQGVAFEYWPWPWVQVDWRWQNFYLPGNPPGSNVSYNWKTTWNNGITTWTMTYPVTLEAQGTYRLQANARYCYKPCPTCQPVQNELRLDANGAAFVPLPNATVDRLRWLLNEESLRYGSSLEIYAISTDLEPNLKSLLGVIARGEFYNCNGFGICAKRDPARVQRVLTDRPDALRNLVATGCLAGGIIYGCQAYQNSRVYDIGPKLQGFGVLIASGGKHDYIAFGPGLVYGGGIYLFEGPKGAGGMLKEALLMSFMEKQGKEVR